MRREPGAPRKRLALPRRTARLRLTLYYATLFLASGATLLTVTYLLFKHETASVHAPGILVAPSSAERAQPSPTNRRPRPNQSATGRALPTSPPITALHSPLPSSRSEQALLRGANRQRSSDAHQLLIVSALGLAILTTVSVLLGWLAAGRALRPLRTINNTARRISATNLHQRLTLDGPPDEFTELGATLNALFGRLQASFEAQRRFVAHASHELRTPLTLTRAILDVALDSPHPTIDSLRSACQDAVQAGEQQEQLIDALLTLATSERGLERQQPFDLAHAAEHVLRAARREIDHQRVKLNTALAAAPTVGDLRLADRLITNLLDNALRYNIAAGTVEMTTGVANGRPFVTVANTGPIVPAAEINRLLEPFQRLNPTQNGSGFGLGLSIVQAIATAHDATLTAQARPEGGLDIQVRFRAQTPLANPIAESPSDQRSHPPLQTEPSQDNRLRL